MKISDPSFLKAIKFRSLSKQKQEADKKEKLNKGDSSLYIRYIPVQD